MLPSRRGAAQVVLEAACAGAIEPYGVRIWTANPADMDGPQWSQAALLLDETEQLRSRRFRSESDRRAYVLVHALRRAALACALGADPQDIVISHDAKGKPVLGGRPAGERTFFFSHSRSREAVTCAVSTGGPVGIDVECLDAGLADFDLLARFMALPDAQRRDAELGPDRMRQFFFYWTALEAFWKAAGTGLSDANPRIRCTRNRSGLFDIALDAEGTLAPVARVIPAAAPERCLVTLACMTHPLTDQPADG